MTQKTIAERSTLDTTAIIRAGGLVAMPTETVYGLAADATSDAAVARIFEAKGRPQFNPLIVHVAGAGMAARYVEFPPVAERLAAAFWPGPLTLVLPRKAGCTISLLASAGLNTLGVRAPNHDIAQSLIRAVGGPLAAPSANPSGAISPTCAEHVQDGLGDKVDIILDGGPCPVGVESTIVKIEGDAVFLLRPGGVAREAIERVVGKTLSNPPHTDNPQAPGMLASHYAPRALLRLNAAAPEPGEAFLGFGKISTEGPYAFNLSASGDTTEAAANLFAYLRRLDALCTEHGLSRIAVAPIPGEGLGEAINDRLARASAPRG
ncbi:MAG: threonylcarbamoyl-AMP synthase [Alphaproteobacteria bacterium]|nr:threonylcarbamoyl-AMP synthase [Alphaproteobacteria bacterium]